MDLNIEHMTNDIKKVQEALHQGLKKVWLLIGEEELCDLIESMKRRTAIVIKARD